MLLGTDFKHFISNHQAKYGANSKDYVLFILPIFPVRGHGVCSLVNEDTLLELRSKLTSDAFPVTTGDFSGI